MHSPRPFGESVGLAATAALFLCGIMSAQVEGTGPKPTIPGRRSLAGTLSPAQPNRTFPIKLGPGVYRLTYVSSASSAVLQVTVDGLAIGLTSPTQPFATVMRIVNDQLQGTTDLLPTGLCSSDVVADGTCAGQKFHFRLTHESAVSIKVTGRPKSVAAFKLLLDPIQTPPVAEELQVNAVFNAYLVFEGDTAKSAPVAEYRLRVPKGQRIGILVGSPDFTSVVEARTSDGVLVAENSGFNEILDPCREVRIDRLPKFDPYSQTDSYITLDPEDDTTYTVHVQARYPGETGLYILRTFDLSDPKIEPGQMRSGVLNRRTREFTLTTPPGWKPEGNRIMAYSALPISVVLKDASGRPLATSVNQPRESVQQGVQTSQLSLMYSTAIDLDAIQAASLANARLEFNGAYDIPDQMFLVGFAANWGSCGGGAIDPLATTYPPVAEFRDRGYPIEAIRGPLDKFEAILYSVARGSLRWYFLLQCPGGDQSDPADLVSNYIRFVPDHVPIADLLVDYEVAVRIQFSSGSGAARLWTRVRRRGYKEKQWQLDLAQGAKTQQLLADQLRDSLSHLK